MAKAEKDPELIELARGLKNTPWCEEYERMVSGMYYNCIAPELVNGRHRGRCMAREFNDIDHRTGNADEIEAKKSQVLEQMLGRVGPGTFIEAPLIVDYGCNIIMGKYCFANFGFTVLDVSLVIIGDHVLFGPNVSIYGAAHETSVLSRVKATDYGLPVRIEDDCWIGGGTVILPGVTIGKGSTVGAGSVVTKSIPPHSVAMGSPARVVKTIQTIEEELADPANPYRDIPLHLPADAWEDLRPKGQ